MTHKERLFHSIMFELVALVIMTGAATLLTGNNMGKMAGLALVLSLIAMSWNYIYNFIYDKLFGSERANRTFKVRILHGLGFELGLLVVTLPLLMWVLQLDFWTVLLMDIGLVIFFLVYAIVFNWCYDMIRQYLVGKSKARNIGTTHSTVNN